MMIGWTPVHSIDAYYVDAITPNVRSAATCPAHLKAPGNLVPHGGNERDECIYKVEGDETEPRGHRFNTVSCQKQYQTYQFKDLIMN